MCCLPALQTAEPCPLPPAALPPTPPQPSRGAGPGRRRRGDLGVLGRLGSCICVFAKEDRVGQGTCSRRPSTDACLPCPCSHGLRPAWGCSRRLPPGGDCPAETILQARGRPPLAKAPGRTLPRLFIPYSVTFLFYFTLIMIIQEYYLR